MTSLGYAQNAPALDSTTSGARPHVVMPTPIETIAVLPHDTTGNSRVWFCSFTWIETVTVLNAKLATGEEPFATIALETAQRFRFTPALKDGVATECRFLFEVPWRFEPARRTFEPSATPTKVDNTASTTLVTRTTTRPLPPPVTRDEIEVLIQGTRVPPGAQSLTAAEAREIPATFGDPLRAVEVLPGVTPVMAGLPYFYVRGVRLQATWGYFVDGVRVPLLWHALVGPSVIHPATLDKVTLYRGAYPAQYGRYAGAIVTADTVAPSPQWRGEAGIRLIDSSLMVSAPLGVVRRDLPEATALVSGRYSYTGLALSLLSNKVDLGYWDYQALIDVPVFET